MIVQKEARLPTGKSSFWRRFSDKKINRSIGPVLLGSVLKINRKLIFSRSITKRTGVDLVRIFGIIFVMTMSTSNFVFFRIQLHILH